jgi:hypothetical protein
MSTMPLLILRLVLLLLLVLQVQSSGLSAKADNVASWKQQLRTWQGSIQDRCALPRRRSADASKKRLNRTVCAWCPSAAFAVSLRIVASDCQCCCWQIEL